MIIVNLMGGLGNQMFQYASGLALASATGGLVHYSTDIYKHQKTFNGFELDMAFGISPLSASPSDLAEVLGYVGANPYFRRAAMRYRGLQSLLPDTAVFEHNFSYDGELADKLQDGGYLHGYWQSEKYFQGVTRDVRSAFSFKNVENIKLAETGKTNVSLHVRRGDYLQAGSIHASCDASYYQRALEAIAVPLEATTLHVFSDDPDWAKQAISRIHPDCRIVQGNVGVDSYKDMYLMSQCDHHIIANSSFSWWGAWLNASREKRVVAPKRWFTNPLLSDESIVPLAWRRV